jgi:hypothetical protein
MRVSMCCKAFLKTILYPIHHYSCLDCNKICEPYIMNKKRGNYPFAKEKK